MSDERLRELERRWRGSGATHDEHLWLAERARQGESLDWPSYSRLAALDPGAAAAYLEGMVERGELTAHRVHLAAWCAHEPARLARVERDANPPEELTTWLLRTRDAGTWVFVHAMHALFLALRPLAEEDGELADPRLTSAVAAAERAAAAFDEPALARAEAVSLVPSLAGLLDERRDAPTSARFLATLALLDLGALLGERGDSLTGRGLYRALAHVEAICAADREAESEIRREVGERLVPFLLDGRPPGLGRG